MKKLPTWASLAIISYDQNFGYAIETISVDANSCTLSGAWDFETLDDPVLTNILHSRLIVTSGIENVNEFAQRFSSIWVDLKTFISDASESAREGMHRFESYVAENAQSYSEYMAIPPAERRNLPKVVKKKLEPVFFHSWEISFDQMRPENTLREIGKRESIEGTPANMKRLIATSWLVKHLIDRWREDELERTSRVYLYPEGQSFQILPNSWMQGLSRLERDFGR